MIAITTVVVLIIMEMMMMVVVSLTTAVYSRRSSSSRSRRRRRRSSSSSNNNRSSSSLGVSHSFLGDSCISMYFLIFSKLEWPHGPIKQKHEFIPIRGPRFPIPFDETWADFFLQASRSFLNRPGPLKTSGKPKIRDQHFQTIRICFTTICGRAYSQATVVRTSLKNITLWNPKKKQGKAKENQGKPKKT